MDRTRSRSSRAVKVSVEAKVSIDGRSKKIDERDPQGAERTCLWGRVSRIASAPMPRRPQIAVIGAGEADPELVELARGVGREIARAGAVLVTGGRGGVMGAASAGAREEGGTTVGVLPGRDANDSPPDEAVEIALFTGLGQARNVVVVLSAAAVIAVGGGWGTLSEIALAAKHGIPVVLLESWGVEPPDGAVDLDLLTSAETAEEAVGRALENLESGIGN